MAQGTTVAYQVIANGSDLTELLKKRLLSLVVSDEVGINSDMVEIRLDDRDNAIAIPPFGADLTIGMGYVETGIVDKGHYRVDEIEVEGGPQRDILIRARSADSNLNDAMPLIKAGKNRTWLKKNGDPMNIKDIAGIIAGFNGLGLKCDSGIGDSFPPTDQQTSESDIHYLGREVRVLRGQLKVANGMMLIFQQGAGLSASGLSLATIKVTPTDCMRWRCLMTRRSSHRKVTATWADAAGIEHDVTIGDPNDQNSNTRLQEIFSDDDEATNAATSKGNALAVGSESVSLTMIGNPFIGAEVKLSLTGFKAGVDRTWVVARVEHRIDNNGFVSDVEAVNP